MNIFKRLKDGLKKTRSVLGEGLATLVLGSKEIDEELFDEIETILLQADVGIDATEELITKLTEQSSRKQLKNPQVLISQLKEDLIQLLEPCEKNLQLDVNKKPFVILMIGVNGVGKTTTIGKLTKLFQKDGKKVMLAAGDTFRAAAIEQLQVWGERNKVPVIAQHPGADSASVVYDALESAKARGVDVLIADTAGRLHNKEHLMRELDKIFRVMKKFDQDAPHEVMLVLDATCGQNALVQAREFHKLANITGLTITKLDGTAKGGILFAIAKQLEIPIRYIGVGEKVDDLRPFAAKDFVDAVVS